MAKPQEDPNLPVSTSKSLSKKSEQALSWTPDEQSSLAVILGRVFDLQKQYGKSADQINNIVAGFCWALGKYPLLKVVGGIQQYILDRSDMPTPADIRAIIDPPPPKKEWDKSVYIKLQQVFKAEGPYGLNEEEYEYIRGYEENVLRTHRQTDNQ